MFLNSGILTLTESELCESAAYAWQRAHPGQRLELVMCQVANSLPLGGSFEFLTLEALQKAARNIERQVAEEDLGAGPSDSAGMTREQPAPPMSPEARAALLEAKPKDL